MNTNNLNKGGLMRKLLLVVLITAGLASCNKEDSPNNADEAKKNKAAFAMTDAPMDNAEVKGVVVTVSEIWVDGEKVEGFSKTTVEVSALTEGRTELLKETEMEASSFSEVVLKLDYNTDENGNAPGCYLIKVDGSKDQMKSTSNEIRSTKFVELNSESTTTVVFDFDLRKMVREESEDNYEFVSKSEMEASLRTVIEVESSQVKGNVDDQNSNMTNKTIVYLYATGTYSDSEMEGDGTSHNAFAKAITSAEIKTDDSFHLAFVEDGDYEIYLFTYDDQDQDGEYEIKGKAQLLVNGNSSFNVNHNDINGSLNLDLTLTTILNL